MKSWAKPTADQVERAIALLGHPEQVRYFFDRLENPEWIEPLRQRGWLRTPPAGQPDPERGTVLFPAWPQARFLVRMAPKKPELVRDIIRDVAETTNPWVHEALVEGLLQMPASVAATLVGYVNRWIAGADRLLWERQAAQLIIHLAAGGEIRGALRLARSLLAILPHPGGQAAPQTDERFALPPEPRTRLGEWDYGEVIRTLQPQLTEHAEMAALELFGELLSTAVRLSRRDAAQVAGEDHSWIWRRAIEEAEEHHRQDLKNVLVDAVRETAESLARSRVETVARIVERLEARRWHIFRRIGLHLLARFAEHAPALAARRLTDRELFEEPWARHEYALLAKAWFDRLAVEDQNTVIGWIEQGPDVEAFRRNQHEFWGRSVTEDEITRYCEMWQRDRLAPIQEGAPEPWKQRYEALVAAHGEPVFDDAPIRSASYVGPTSPKKTDELQALNADELVQFLREWTAPERDDFGPSPEGLGRALTDVVRDDAPRLSAAASRFVGLDATYVRAVIRGLEEAVRQGKAFEWEEVVALCRWVLEQRDPAPRPERGSRDRDPHWGWARKAVASLVSAGCQTNAIPFPLRGDVWALVEPLTRDPDPPPDEEAPEPGSPTDPANRSINTTRGEAVHGTIQYALWVRRQLEKLEDGKARAARGFEEMPEAQAVLDARLDRTVERSLTIRAVYGQHLPWLWLLDPGWLGRRLAQIFPPGDESRPFRQVAWNTYVIFCPPYDTMLEVLRPAYGEAIEWLGTGAGREGSDRDPETQLAEHLMLYYARGRLAREDALFRRFWERAPANVRRYAVAFLGRTLREDEVPVSEPVLGRLRDLWMWRVEVVQADPARHGDELKGFGWWFTSGKFDEAWALAQLEIAVAVAGAIDHDLRVFPRLAKAAERFPLEATRILARVLSGKVAPWRIMSWRESIEAVLRHALGSGREDAKHEAEQLTHRLGRAGYFEFRDVLRGTPE